jgi:hypothetical protein
MHDNIPIVATIAFFATSGWMLKLTLSYRARMKELAHAKLERFPSEARLERVEQAVEAIVIEIERVSEGQRFVTKLLNERAQPIDGAARTAVGRRVDTPH